MFIGIILKIVLYFILLCGGVIYNFARLLEILDIDPNQLLPITHPVKFKNVILPDESFFLAPGNFKNVTPHSIDGTDDDFGGNDGSFFTREYVEIVDIIKNFALKNFSPMNKKNFYFIQGKNQLGEERIANYFISKDYVAVHPERLPVEVQLNILANCENFASCIGSISHNIIFMNANANVTLIPRRAAFSNIYQQALNQIHDLNISYVDSAFSLFSKGHQGPYCYIVSEKLREHFGDEIGEKYTSEDFETFLSYVRYAKSQGLNENPEEFKYLGNTFLEFIAQLKSRTDLLEKFGVTLK